MPITQAPELRTTNTIHNHHTIKSKTMDEGNNKGGSSKHYMMGGDGPNSYSQNSDYQKQLLLSAEDLMIELTNEHLDIEKPPFDPRNAFRIADFGCSVGPNSFVAVKNIIEAIESKYKSNQKNPVTPEFQVFLNDLVGNDFNTLFKNLPATRQYFVAAVPGSFHGRLFPDETLQFAHCSTSLHWISKIPKALTERSSTAWNRGRTHYLGAPKEVKDAYLHQHKEDVEAFLNARAKELVDGGLMVIISLGFPDEVCSSKTVVGLLLDIFQSCLEDMAKIEKITQEKVDSFNVPWYFPLRSELKAMIEENGLFSIKRIARLPSPAVPPNPQVYVSYLRAIMGELTEEHFGNSIIEELFTRTLEKVAKSPLLTDETLEQQANYFVCLKRKARLEERL